MPLPSIGRLGSRTNLKPVRSARRQHEAARPAVEAEDKELTSYLAALAPDRDDPESTGSGRRFGESQVHQVRLNRIASQQLRDLAAQQQLSVQELTQKWILDRLSWEGQAAAAQPEQAAQAQPQAEPEWEPAPHAQQDQQERHSRHAQHQQADAGWQLPDWEQSAAPAGGYAAQEWPQSAEWPGQSYDQHGQLDSPGQEQYGHDYGQPYQHPHGNGHHHQQGHPGDAQREQYQGQLLTHAGQAFPDEQPYGNGVYAADQADPFPQAPQYPHAPQAGHIQQPEPAYHGPSYGAAQSYPSWQQPEPDLSTEARQNAARVQAWHGGARGRF